MASTTTSDCAADQSNEEVVEIPTIANASSAQTSARRPAALVLDSGENFSVRVQSVDEQEQTSAPPNSPGAMTKDTTFECFRCKRVFDRASTTEEQFLAHVQACDVASAMPDENVAAVAETITQGSKGKLVLCLICRRRVPAGEILNHTPCEPKRRDAHQVYQASLAAASTAAAQPSHAGGPRAGLVAGAAADASNSAQESDSSYSTSTSTCDAAPVGTLHRPPNALFTDRRQQLAIMFGDRSAVQPAGRTAGPAPVRRGPTDQPSIPWALRDSAGLSELAYRSQPRSETQIQDLPVELVLHIGSFFDSPHTLVRCKRVCRTWYEWFSDEALWQLQLSSFTMRSAQNFVESMGLVVHVLLPPRDSAQVYINEVVSYAIGRHTFECELSNRRQAQDVARRAKIKARACRSRVCSGLWLSVIWLALFLFFVLAPLKLDGRLRHASWLGVLSPIWLALPIAIAGAVCSSVMWYGCITGTLLLPAAVTILLVSLKLDGSVSASWPVVLIPFFIVVLQLFIASCWFGWIICCDSEDDSGAALGQIVALGFLCISSVLMVCLIVFVALLTARLDGRLPNASPWLIALPLFIGMFLTLVTASFLGLIIAPVAVIGWIAIAVVALVISLLIATQTGVIKSYFVALFPVYPLLLVMLPLLGFLLPRSFDENLQGPRYANRPFDRILVLEPGQDARETGFLDLSALGALGPYFS